MEEKTVPWWRKALNYALDGIRSGFGLFSRAAKPKAVVEPEAPADRKENLEQEEVSLTQDSPDVKANAAEAVEVASPRPCLMRWRLRQAATWRRTLLRT